MGPQHNINVKIIGPEEHARKTCIIITSIIILLQSLTDKRKFSFVCAQINIRNGHLFAYSEYTLPVAPTNDRYVFNMPRNCWSPSSPAVLKLGQ